MATGLRLLPWSGVADRRYERKRPGVPHRSEVRRVEFGDQSTPSPKYRQAFPSEGRRAMTTRSTSVRGCPGDDPDGAPEDETPMLDMSADHNWASRGKRSPAANEWSPWNTAVGDLPEWLLPLPIAL